jgi:sterol 3beta-glucosyltransferase
MHITFLALGSRGDVQPYATLGHGLKAAGHQVRFITFESFGGLVAENGLDFHPIRGSAEDLVAKAGADMLALVRSFGSLAAGYAQDLSDPKLGETDLFINQLPAGLYGFDLAEKYAVPLALAAVIPLAQTNAFPMMGLPKLPLPGYNKLTYGLAEQMLWQMFRGVINHWRKQTLGLASLPWTGHFRQLRERRVPILNGFSQQVVPRPADWGANIHITGSWFPEAKPWQPPANLQAFLEAGSPPVFIGFGSMPIKNPARTTQVVLEALRQSGQRGILQAGWGGLGDQPLPETVFKIGYVPYHWLFRRMGMVIHHGGSGTTAFGVAAGVPGCVVSFIFDQHYWGERLAELGVGPQPIRHSQLTVARLAEAMRLGMSDPTMRQKAAALGQKIRAENGVETARRLIEQMV